MEYYCLKDNMKRYFFFIILIFISFTLTGISDAKLSGRASISQSERKTVTDGVTTKNTTVSEIYSLGFSKELTTVIRVGGDARISINTINGEKTERIFPQITLNLNPPQLYDLSFSFNRTDSDPSHGDRRTTSNMNTRFFLPTIDWPSLAISYNRSTSTDFLDPHKNNNVNDSLNLSSNYDFNVKGSDVRLNYSFTHSIQEDKVTIAKTESLSHIVNADVSRSFMERKMNVTANASVNINEHKQESLFPTRFETVIAPSQGLFSIDDTPGTDLLTNSQELIDGNLDKEISDPLIDLNGPDRNIGLSFSVVNEVKEIHLYIKRGEYPELSDNVNSRKYKFQVYSSNNNGSDWIATTLTAVTYNPTFPRIELVLSDSGIRSKFFKVVNTASPASTVTINVTEIKAVGFLLKDATTGTSSDTMTKSVGFIVSYNPMEKLAMNYRLNLEQREESRNTSTVNTINQGLSAVYTFVPKYLSLSASYSGSSTSTNQKSKTVESKLSDSGSNNYSLSFLSTPLPTLSATLGFNLSDSTLDGVTQSTSEGLSTNVRMDLYEGVNLLLTNAISTTKRPSTSAKSKSINSRASINLEPWQRFTIVLNTSYITSETENQNITTSSNRKTIGGSASYSMTRRLYFSYSTVIEPSSSQTLSATWLPTDTIQTDVRYGISGSSNTFGTNLRWNPFARFNLSVSYNSTEFDGPDGDKTESIFGRASLSF